MEKELEKIKEEDKKIIVDYCIRNYFKENIEEKKLVLSCISKAIKKELDDESIDFIIKEFVDKNASIKDFNDDTLNNVLVTIFTYIDTHFSMIPALRLNSIRADYRPKIDFSGMRYEDFDPMFDDFAKKKDEKDKSKKELRGWVKGYLPVDTKKERM